MSLLFVSFDSLSCSVVPLAQDDTLILAALIFFGILMYADVVGGT